MKKRKIRKKLECINKQVSSGKMTINQARISIGLFPIEDKSHNTHLMAEKFCSNKRH